MTTRSPEVARPAPYPGIKKAIVAAVAGSKRTKQGKSTAGSSIQTQVAVIRRGVSSKVFVDTARRLGLAQDELARKLGLKPRTIASRVASERAKLKPDETERVLRIRRIFDQASRVFGGPAAAREWLMKPAYGLEEQRPIDLMDTELGAGQVRDYLGAIEQGNYW
jgi:putative toxin-antitoxin system antitoxin component (TIGR02293 family)